MDQSSSRYYFRKKDYAKIRNWYQMTKENYVPQDTLDARKIEKAKQWHFKFQFHDVELTEEYAHSILNYLSSAKQLIFLSSIFQRSGGLVVCHGKQLSRQCNFHLNSYSAAFNEDITLYFYLEDITPRDYQFCLEIQVVTKEGEFFKLGSVRHSLGQQKQSKGKFMLTTNHFQHFQLEEVGKTKTKKEAALEMQYVGCIEFQQELQDIKDISKFLPPLKIIDQQSRLPPCINFNLKKKKQQIVLDPPYKIILESLLIKIGQPANMKKQLLANNPFSLSHKQLVEFEVKEYSITIDLHNGWKFLNQNKNSLVMQLVVENEQEIYVSSKQTERLNLGYYQNDYTLFVIILKCKVQFRMKDFLNQKRTNDFIIGWLPLPLDLSLKENKFDMFFVNDHPFPASLLFHLGVPSNFTATFTHPLYQKYKGKQDDRKVMMNDLPITQSNQIEPFKYAKIHIRKNTAQTLSSAELAERQTMIESEIESMKTLIEQNEQQYQKKRFVTVTGRFQKGQQKLNNSCELIMQECVGRILRAKIQIISLIPETEIPSSYYLPRKLKGTLYCLRQKINFYCHITENQAKYHIPLNLNCSKSVIDLKINVDSVQQFEALVNSSLIVTLHQEQAYVLYAKGTVSLMEVLGKKGEEKISYLILNKWHQSSQKCFGTILLNTQYELEVLKPNYKRVQELSFEKELQKLPMEERLRMRIGNFKGDHQVKSKAVSMLKQKKHIDYVSNVVERQFMSDGQMQYEIGSESYYLVAFTNEDKSQNNIFTFHLNCPYAQLVTDEQEYRKIVSSLNVEQQNYKGLQYIMKERIEESYYQTSLQFNQSIGLLIRLNVNEFKPTFTLKKIELIIKRNTLETKRVMLKCALKQPLVWDVIESYELQQDLEGQLRTPLAEEMYTKYKEISILNESIKYDYRNREIIYSKHRNNHYQLYCLATPTLSKLKKFVLYKAYMIPGKYINVIAGEKFIPDIDYQNTFSVQILRSEASQVHLPSSVRFNLPLKNGDEEISIQMLAPVTNYPVIISTYDLSGQKLWSYLLKVTAVISSNYRKIQLTDRQNINFTLNCENPYACRCKFSLFVISKSLKLSQTEFQIGGYESKVVIGRLSEWSMLQSSVMIFMNDMRGNIIQTTEVAFASKESIIYQQE